ncbi:MAG: PEP-CTERM sorting domain-containing protein [Planctomycetia bacterium]
MASRIRPAMMVACGPARSVMKLVAAIALSLVVLESVRAEVVFSNLNTDPSTTNLTYGFAQYAQRFTTVSEGTGLHLDLNIIAAQNGPQSYAVELWSADGAGTNVNALLAPIGSGTVSTTDLTALTSFDLTYPLAASTNYFVRLTSTADLAWVLGPSSSTTLNSVFRYGVASLNNADSSVAGGMKVDVNAVPEPSTYVMALAGLACGGFSRWRRRKRA